MKYLTPICCILFLCVSTPILAQENILESDNVPVKETERDIIKNAASPSSSQASSSNTLIGSDIADQAAEQPTKKNLNAYITDEFYVPVRSLPDTNGRVIHRGLKSGTVLQTIEENNGWSKIKTESGLEGWVQTRHLTADPIAKVLLALAQQKNEQLKDLNKDLEEVINDEEPTKEIARQKIAELSLENERLVTQLKNSSLTSPNSRSMQNQIQSLVSQNNLLVQQNDVLKARLSNFEKDDLYRSFLYGAIAVFLGTILAALVPRLKGRRRFEDWG